MATVSKKLRIFETHGVHFTGESGDQLIGSCPFTGKEDKFYVNRRTLLWDSKTGGQSGNVAQFLRLISEQYVRALTPELTARLARDRGLPASAFQDWHLGWHATRQAYTLPVRDVRGHVEDIRMYTIGQSAGVISTAGAHVGLLGAEQLPKHPAASVYICEGEWDAIALRWMMRHLDQEGVVVAVPGAGTFKPEWVPWLSGRRVHTLYDMDGPGEKGEHLALSRLKNQVQLLTFIHWPDSFPEGFDVRDWVIAGAIRKKTPRRCWRSLTEMFQTEPRRTVLPNGTDPGVSDDDEAVSSPVVVPERRPTKWVKAPQLSDVHHEFKRWLYLDSTDAIDVMLATAISQQIDGEPVWMFIVAPPGGAKTETLSSLSWVENVYMTSSVTPHSLISGANWKGNADPSLIPKLDGKIMVIKDFTSILSMRDNEKDEIFGILRDAYDGTCGKEFGNGVVRRYHSRFTILAAVTPSIYALSSSHTALGERFLKFGIGDNLVHHHEDEIINRAIDNINKETSMRDDLADVVHAFLTKRLGIRRIPVGELPALPSAIRQRIIALARFGARMRGSVTRDNFRNDIVTSRPSAEVGSRLGKQLAKLSQALAVVRGRSVVTPDDYRLVKKVMLDTIPQRTEDLLRNLLQACPNESDTTTASEMSHRTRYPQMTINRILQDLTVLDITKRGPVQKVGVLNSAGRWTLSPYIRGVIKNSGLYTTEEDLTRPSGRIMVRTIRRRRKRVAIPPQGGGP
jgi:hypothetical protein